MHIIRKAGPLGAACHYCTQQQVSYSAHMKGSNAFCICNLLIACQVLFELTEKLTMEPPPTSYTNMYVSKYISKISCTESCWSPASDKGKKSNLRRKVLSGKLFPKLATTIYLMIKITIVETTNGIHIYGEGRENPLPRETKSITTASFF